MTGRQLANTEWQLAGLEQSPEADPLAQPMINWGRAKQEGHRMAKKNPGTEEYMGKEAW